MYGSRMNNNDDNHVWKEDPDKTGKVNPEFIKKTISQKKTHLVDYFKAFLESKLTRTRKHGTDLWATFTNIKLLLSNIGHEGRLRQGINAFLLVWTMAFIGLIMFNSAIARMRF